MRQPLFAAMACCLLLTPALAAGPTLTVELPQSAEPRSAIAVASQSKLETRGAIAGRKITFSNLLPDTAYDLRITLADGSVLQGVDLAWHSPEPPPNDPDPMDDDDRQQLRELFDAIKGFENKRNILILSGNHDRAVILAELIRDTPFHSATPGEIIWRIELWYFKNQHGGWEKVTQASKTLRRERFKSQEDYTAETAKLKWTAALGGLRLKKNEARSLALTANEVSTGAGRD